ncbi:Hypothetical predicted protein [Mytilus galloprovincialis]|uniref:C-type lectin domain-containing protein n=1 Tax=Mytilus galloprovincialis TaxID=29158 RepID=A0A8B6DTS8_MYTGA|nr:Hypothetical predicted protein [Mytilus galloprovincialis]
MGLVSIISLSIIGLIIKDVTGLPCLTDESKTKFEATRKALKYLQTSVDNRIRTLQNDIKSKVKKIDDDMGSLVSDFQKRQWKKYNSDCYYYGSDTLSWFKAEQRCKQIGGHLAKIDDEAENKWVKDNRSKKDNYWIGLTDLKEGEWRWSYDQTLAKY